MARHREEEIRMAVVMSIANGLKGAALFKLAKRVESVAQSDEREVLKTLTLIELEPGLGVESFKLIAVGKSIIKGDETRLGLFDELVRYMAGVEPQLPQLLKEDLKS
jgi:hypothetical protein